MTVQEVTYQTYPTSGFGVLGQFTLTTVGDYKIYRTTTLQAGGAGSSITYNLT